MRRKLGVFTNTFKPFLLATTLASGVFVLVLAWIGLRGLHSPSRQSPALGVRGTPRCEISWEHILQAAEKHTAMGKWRLEQAVAQCETGDEVLLARWLLDHWDSWTTPEPSWSHPEPLHRPGSPDCWQLCRSRPDLAAEINRVKPYIVVIGLRVGRDGWVRAATVPRWFRKWPRPKEFTQCVANCFLRTRFRPAIVEQRFVSAVSYEAVRWDYF